MRKIFALPLAAVVAAGFVACDSNPTALAPEGPNFELFDKDQRVDKDDVNAHVYGSFVITFEGEPAVLGGGVGANFPGKGKSGSGTCGEADKPDLNGVWFNPQGRRTSGSPDNPHPHCVGTGGGSVEVVLEPISVENANVGEDDEFLRFTARDGQGVGFNYDGVRIQGSGGRNTNAAGVIEAYAILASTLASGDPVRVGILTIDLEQFKLDGANLFADKCVLDEAEYGPRCLNKVILADYAPWGDNGVGRIVNATDEESDDYEAISGFLFWSPATSPFNYSDMDNGEGE
jgi:hypothetical protein